MHGAFFGESPIDRMMGFGRQGGFGSIFDEIEREFLNHQGGMGPPMGPQMGSQMGPRGGHGMHPGHHFSEQSWDDGNTYTKSYSTSFSGGFGGGQPTFSKDGHQGGFFPDDMRPEFGAQ